MNTEDLLTKRHEDQTFLDALAIRPDMVEAVTLS